MSAGQEKRPPWWEAGLWMAVLGPFFFVIYGLCNWISSQQPGVPSFFWEWERHIPFVPAFIVPYMSIDLFFAAAVFLCRTRRELHTVAARILFAISASGICFLLFPLRYAFHRPVVEGIFGLMFAPLNANDLPFNLAPSLHISLRAILWGVYGRALIGSSRKAVKIWFILIGFSTLLVWQHHLIDVITGFLMALIAFYVFPDRDKQEPVLPVSWIRRGRLAAYYGAGAAVLCIAGFFLLPGGAVLWWPALSLAIVATAYAGVGVAVFQKSRGTLSAGAEWTLLPWLVLQSAIRARWRRGEPWADVDCRVRFGRRVTSREAKVLLSEGFVAVLDLTAESTECRQLVEKTAYRQLSVLDLTVPHPDTLALAVEFISEHVRSGRVYIHCELGYSRSAAVAAAWLLASEGAASPEDAMDQIRKARPVVLLGRRCQTSLSQFAEALPRPSAPPALVV